MWVDNFRLIFWKLSPYRHPWNSVIAKRNTEKNIYHSLNQWKSPLDVVKFHVYFKRKFSKGNRYK